MIYWWVFIGRKAKSWQQLISVFCQRLIKSKLCPIGQIRSREGIFSIFTSALCKWRRQKSPREVYWRAWLQIKGINKNALIGVGSLHHNTTIICSAFWGEKKNHLFTGYQGDVTSQTWQPKPTSRQGWLFKLFWMQTQTVKKVPPYFNLWSISI